MTTDQPDSIPFPEDHRPLINELAKAFEDGIDEERERCLLILDAHRPEFQNSPLGIVFTRARNLIALGADLQKISFEEQVLKDLDL